MWWMVCSVCQKGFPVSCLQHLLRHMSCRTEACRSFTPGHHSLNKKLCYNRKKIFNFSYIWILSNWQKKNWFCMLVPPPTGGYWLMPYCYHINVWGLKPRFPIISLDCTLVPVLSEGMWPSVSVTSLYVSGRKIKFVMFHAILDKNPSKKVFCSLLDSVPTPCSPPNNGWTIRLFFHVHN